MENAKAIWFDMDGTIADLYGVEGWLEMLTAKDPTPYEKALPLVKMNILARRLNMLQKQGYEINIISWLAKNSTEEYDEKVTFAKKKWLAKHLASVKFNKIDIVPYGTPKEEGRNGILFDDEFRNRLNWDKVENNNAYNQTIILEVLKNLA